MIHRLLEMLRRQVGHQPPASQYRPNQLRPDSVRTQRLRREAVREEFQEHLPQRREPEIAQPPRSVQPPMVAALRSRAGLRRAMLLKEIIDRPVALRGPRADDRDT